MVICLSIPLGIRYAGRVERGEEQAMPVWAWLLLIAFAIVVVVAIMVPMVWLIKRVLDGVEKPSIELIRKEIAQRGGEVVTVEQQMYNWGPFPRTLTGIVFRATYLQDGVQRELWVKIMGPRFGQRTYDWRWDYVEGTAGTVQPG